MIQVYVMHNKQVDYVGDCYPNEIMDFTDMFKGTDESPSERIIFIDDTAHMPHDAFEDVIVSEHIKLKSMFTDYPEIVLILRDDAMEIVKQAGTFPFEPDVPVADWPVSA